MKPPLTRRSRGWSHSSEVSEENTDGKYEMAEGERRGEFRLRQVTLRSADARPLSIRSRTPPSHDGGPFEFNVGARRGLDSALGT